MAIQALLLGMAGGATLGVAAGDDTVGAEGPAGVVCRRLLTLMAGVAVVAALDCVAVVAGALNGGLRKALAVGMDPFGGVVGGLGAADVRVHMAGRAVGSVGDILSLMTGNAGAHGGEHFVARDAHLVEKIVTGEAIDLGVRMLAVIELDLGHQNFVDRHRRRIIRVGMAHRAFVGALRHVGLVGVTDGAIVHRREGHQRRHSLRGAVTGVAAEAEILNLELVVDDDAVGTGRRRSRRGRARRESEGRSGQRECRYAEEAQGADSGSRFACHGFLFSTYSRLEARHGCRSAARRRGR